MESEYAKSTKYCTFQDIDYYKYSNQFFLKMHIILKNAIKFGGGKFKIDRKGKITFDKEYPVHIKELCTKAFTQKGEYHFSYIDAGEKSRVIGEKINTNIFF